MSKIIQILNYEEGFREKPYHCSERYPTVGCGFKIGPKGSSLSNYTFSIPRNVSDVWLQTFVNTTWDRMIGVSNIWLALGSCNQARRDILTSMAYQIGVDGLAKFTNTLEFIRTEQFDKAADNMMNSLWAKQTPNRARRHARVMREGTYRPYEGLL